MKEIIFSASAFKVYSSFCTNASVAIFLASPLSSSALQLIWRIVFAIILMYFAIIFDKISYDYRSN